MNKAPGETIADAAAAKPTGASPAAGETRAREARSLVEASEAHPGARKSIITGTPGTSQGIPEDVAVHDAATWLLGDHANE